MAILVGWQALVCAACFSVAHAVTEVIGIISSDTKWTKAKSPYNITGPVLVKKGVTLTIEAGAIVNINEYYIQVNGTLRVIGRSDDLVRISGNELRFTKDSPSWDEQTGSGSIIENAFLDLKLLKVDTRGLLISHNYTLERSPEPKISNNYIIGKISAGHAIVTNNLIRGSISDAYNKVINNTISKGCSGSADFINNTVGAGIGGGGTILNNTIGGKVDVMKARIAGNIIKGGITIFSGIVESNLILAGGTYGIEIDGGICVIQNNTIMNCTIGFYSEKGTGEIHYNNIIGCMQELVKLKYPSQTSDINATYNWWGTTDEQEISKRIHDSKYDFNLGTVIFKPFLTAPNPQAPEPRTRIEFLQSYEPLFPGETPEPPYIEEEDLTTTTPTPHSPAPTSQQETSTPNPEIQQKDQTTAIIGSIIVIVVLVTGLSLLIYLIKK